MISQLARLTAALLSLPLIIGSASGHEYTKGGITVVHPWTRATVATARNGAAFMEIKAAANKSDKLIGARSEAAERVEIHTHIMEQGIAKMRKVDGVPIPAGQSAVLDPHGYHIMLIGLKVPLKEGDLLPLTLLFENAGEIMVEATIEPIGALGPHGFEHQPGQAKTSTKAHQN